MYTLDIEVKDVKFAADFDYHAFTETAFLGFSAIWHKGDKIGHLLSFNTIQEIAAQISAQMHANPPSAEEIAKNTAEMQSFRDASPQFAKAEKMATQTQEEREADLMRQMLLETLGLRVEGSIPMVGVEIPDDDSAPFPIH